MEKQSLPTALTFDDVLLKPGYSGFLRSEVEVTTKLSRNIDIAIPIVASPMDTVCEHAMAAGLAQLGGIGFIHRNLTVADQAREVAKVKKQKLLVGAAVGSSPGYEKRVATLISAGVDVLLVDSAHGNARTVLSAIKTIKSATKVDVIGGNVATAEGARAMIDAGVDGIRVGMGPGAICSTRIISGMGVPQLTAIMETVSVARKKKIPVIADGGITYSGEITKALAAGAHSVMLGRILAACSEAPGEIVELPESKVPGRFYDIIDGSKSYKFKTYRGMGSQSAMAKGLKISSEDEFHGKSYRDDVLIAEGVEGLVPVNGSVTDRIAQLIGGLTSGMYYVGCKTITDLHKHAQFYQVTQASLAESHPHDLYITDGGKNYQEK